MENATAFPGSLCYCSTSSVTGLRRLGKQPAHGNAADIQLAPATGHVGKVGENRVSLVEDTVSQQGLMTRFILSLSGKKEEAIRDMPNIIGKALNSPEMQAITGDAVVVALDRIPGRRIKWLIGCNEQTIYWISGRSTRHAFTPAADTLRAIVPEAAWRFYEQSPNASPGEFAERTLACHCSRFRTDGQPDDRLPEQPRYAPAD